MLWSLEARKQVDQEGMVWHVHNLKDTLLAHQTAKGRREKSGEEEQEKEVSEMEGRETNGRCREVKDEVESGERP